MKRKLQPACVGHRCRSIVVFRPIRARDPLANEKVAGSIPVSRAVDVG
jgi:hypothetical protein